MQVKAVAKYIKVQPRKVRIIADQVRDKSALHTLALLRYHTSKGARELRKVVNSAIANAAENHGLDADNLKIATIMVDEGPRQKRMIAKAMGRGARIVKKTSHITVVVEESEAETIVKPHGTKSKPRPTLKDTKKSKGKAPKAEAKPAAEAVSAEEEPMAAEAAEEPMAVETTEEPATEAEPNTEGASEEPVAEPEAEAAEDAPKDGEN